MACHHPLCLLALVSLLPIPAAAQPITFLSAWGVPGGGAGQFDDPYGVAADGAGNVYVADSNNDRIQKFSREGAFLIQWGGAGTAEGEFIQPLGVAADGAATVYVADTANNRIQKFTTSGTFLTAWGSFGSGDGQFSLPSGVAVGFADSILVSDLDHDRMQKFLDGCLGDVHLTLSNGFCDSAKTHEACYSITAGPDFDVYGPDGDLTLTAPLISFENGIFVGVGGSLTARNP